MAAGLVGSQQEANMTIQVARVPNGSPRTGCSCGNKPRIFVMIEFRDARHEGHDDTVYVCESCAQILKHTLNNELSRPHMREVLQAK